MDPEDSDSISDQEDDQGWQDIEDDTEDVKIVSLFDDRTFSTATEMLHYCKDHHDFDIWHIRKVLNLEFLDLIKLVNYVRTNVKSGNLKPDVTSKLPFDDDKYLKPVLEDDALLYNLDDIFDAAPRSIETPLQAEVASLRDQLSTLQSQFTAYRLDVQRSLLQNLNLKPADLSDESNSSSSTKHILHTCPPHSTTLVDKDYFSSYAHPMIHQIMLADQIRTDAYRDFVYDNKSLFANKTVLDVGCGTGILSMFSAKAGAKEVFAVDQSDVIHKARENVWKNGMEGKVKCLHGKIEELSLPTSSPTTHLVNGDVTAPANMDAKVDIIISEWMGYCLLYECMLDSVIYGRDKYLAPNGLMVPSHTTIKIGALVDSDIRIEQIDFWRDVYGFDMSAMLENGFDEVLMQVVPEGDVRGEAVVKELDLYTVSVEQLEFEAPFEMRWEGEGRLEGWVIWFDMLFGTDRRRPSEAVVAANKHGEGAKGFSTGPRSKSTHWYQGICLMKEPWEGIAAGELIKGVVKYAKAAEGERGLHIEIEWQVGSRTKAKQRWKLE